MTAVWQNSVAFYLSSFATFTTAISMTSMDIHAISHSTVIEVFCFAGSDLLLAADGSSLVKVEGDSSPLLAGTVVVFGA